MMKGRTLLLAAAAVTLVQIGFLASAIYSRAALLREGQEITLRTVPVDPRDLLRGDYVALSYDVSRLPVALVRTERPRDNEAEGTVYVRLQRGTGAEPATPLAIGLGAPLAQPLAAGEIDLRGESTTRWHEGVESINIDYGLERFYLPEGLGRPIERAVNERSFTVRAAVGEEGQAQIKAFLDGNKLIYAEPLY